MKDSSGRVVGFEGVIPILQTPFLLNGDLDLESLRREVAYVCSFGVPALAFPAYASEWWKLSDWDRAACAETIVETVAGSRDIIFNVTAQSTHVAVGEARTYARIGATALQCLPPFVMSPSPDQNLGHLRAILEAVELPHVVQLSPGLTGNAMDSTSIVRLHDEYPHFCSIKIDFIPPGPMITQLRGAIDDDRVTFLIGYSGLQLPDAIRRGGRGLMSGCGHIGEDLVVFKALTSQDLVRARLAFQALLPLLNFEMQTVGISVAAHKYRLFEMGIIESPQVRLPGVTLDAFQQAEVADLYEQLDRAFSLLPSIGQDRRLT